jgi:hypothetical protein
VYLVLWKKMAPHWHCEGSRQGITWNIYSLSSFMVKSLTEEVKSKMWKILQMWLTPTLNSNCSLIISNSVGKCMSLNKGVWEWCSHMSLYLILNCKRKIFHQHVGTHNKACRAAHIPLSEPSYLLAYWERESLKF